MIERRLIGMSVIGLAAPLCLAVAAPLAVAWASPMETGRLAAAGGLRGSAASAYLDEFEPLKALSENLSRMTDGEMIAGRQAGVDTIALDFSLAGGGQPFEFSSPLPEPDRPAPGARRDREAPGRTAADGGPTLGRVFRVFINVTPGEGGAKPDATGKPASNKDRRAPEKGTGVGLAATILNSAVHEEFIDAVRIVLRPTLTEGGGVHFSLAGFGDFRVTRSSKTGEITIMEDRSGLAIQAYPGAAPVDRGGPIADPPRGGAELPPEWRRSAAAQPTEKSMSKLLRDVATNPFVWMVAALVAISWMLWMVSARRD